MVVFFGREKPLRFVAEIVAAHIVSEVFPDLLHRDAAGLTRFDEVVNERFIHLRLHHTLRPSHRVLHFGNPRILHELRALRRSGGRDCSAVVGLVHPIHFRGLQRFDKVADFVLPFFVHIQREEVIRDHQRVSFVENQHILVALHNLPAFHKFPGSEGCGGSWFDKD